MLYAIVDASVAGAAGRGAPPAAALEGGTGRIEAGRRKAMSDKTKIEWTQGTDGTPGASWSPWWGCTKVSRGCKHCYAEGISNRFSPGNWGPKGQRRFFGEAHWREPLRWDRAAERAGVRRKVFPSMCDVFEDRADLIVPRERFFNLVQRTPHLDWLVLTKRPENVRPMLNAIRDEVEGAIRSLLGCMEQYGHIHFRNIWIGASVEDQETADARIPHLLRVPAAVRFLSVEPLLAPVNLGLWRVAIPKHEEHWPTERVRNFWVIVGSESGPHARPMNEDWVRSIRDQCQEAGVPFFFKQKTVRGHKVSLPELDGRTWEEFPCATRS
jgi:protein gp37